MGTFMHDYGTLDIPKDKLDAFVEELKKVAYQAGLFDCRYVSAMEKEFLLLAFPSFSDHRIHFDFSYFELDRWEGVGVNLEKMYLWSEKIGWRQFNAASQALYLLAETYSDKLWVSYADSANRPISTIKWLRYVLKKDLHLWWRRSIWNVIEAIHESDDRSMDESECASLIDDIRSDVEKIDDTAFTYAIFNGVKGIVEKYRNSEEYQQNQKDEVWNAIDKEMMVLDAVEKYKSNAAIGEDQQVKRLLQILTHLGKKNNIIIKPLSDDEQDYLCGIIFCPPQLCVKIICEVYGQDFWTLWNQVKKDVDRELGNSETDERVEDGELTTEEFFRISSDDRLYWWSEDGDVTISEETQNWLNQLSVQHKQLCSTVEMESGIMEWQKRLIHFLGDHNKSIYFFEELYYEFLGNFHRAEYRAWLIQLEELDDDLEKCNRLIAVLGNSALREKIFAQK